VGKLAWTALALPIVAIALSSTASATPLRLDYIVTPLGGGIYNYDFTFVVDNNDGSYANGQTFRWFVIGDSLPGPSPLTNFVGDPNSYQNAPYTGFGQTSGGHNGPDLQPVLTDWVTNGVGDFFSFSGTSTADLPQGDLLWSNVTNGSTNPGVRGDFEVANRVPEPASLSLLALAGLGLLRRRR
jgi:hypothetical protein